MLTQRSLGLAGVWVASAGYIVVGWDGDWRRITFRRYLFNRVVLRYRRYHGKRRRLEPVESHEPAAGYAVCMYVAPCACAIFGGVVGARSMPELEVDFRWFFGGARFGR